MMNNDDKCFMPHWDDIPHDPSAISAGAPDRMPDASEVENDAVGIAALERAAEGLLAAASVAGDMVLDDERHFATRQVAKALYDDTSAVLSWLRTYVPEL